MYRKVRKFSSLCLFAYILKGKEVLTFYYLSLGSSRFSSGRVSASQYSEYPDEVQTIWVEFTALFNQRRRRERRSHTQLYNIISQEIHLSSVTLASFYRHQKFRGLLP